MRYTILAFGCLFIGLLSSCGSGEGSKSTDNSTTSPAKTGIAGDDVYKRTCVACHLATGEGLPNTFPPLAKSDYIANRENTIRQVIKGSSGELTVNGKTYNNTMPPQNLTDEEVAAVLTYVYSNFGNSGSAVTAEEVKQVRAKS